jgi:hypothetical protein
MAFRNTKFYRLVLKGMTMDQAYEFITANLKRPTNVYEQRNAYDVFKEVFKIDFTSPQELQALKEKEELIKLREENERLKIEAKQKETVVEKVGDVTETFDPEPDIPASDTGNAADHTTSTVVYNTKEEFKTAHPELKGLAVHHEWQRYVKGLKEKK